MLKPYAVHAHQSKGRFYPIKSSQGRDDFQRDRDRIIHAKSFRRLAHKTQVFVYYVGDHYRNRLTHSLEVAQITRAIARELSVNEDLAELTALAHDLGHPPFGHAGEDALNLKMQDFGGFDHNAQALRIVTFIENRYPEYLGLNLTLESLEGILKHNGPITKQGESDTDLPWAIKSFEHYQKLDLELYAGIEAQIAALCDDIAYNAHDIDDGVRANIFDINMLKELEFCDKIMFDIMRDYPDIAPYPFKHEFIRRLITSFVRDAVTHTQSLMNDANPKCYDDVRHAGHSLVSLSDTGQHHNKILKSFLMKNMYKHPSIQIMTDNAHNVVSGLCDAYMNDDSCLPVELRDKLWGNNTHQQRAICVTDFISGMTDKFAIEEHKRIFKS
jgi:dGTPase